MRYDFIIDVEVGRFCNQKCEYCPDKFIENTTFNDYEKINFDKLFDYITKFHRLSKVDVLLMLDGGEPTIHPNLLEFCKKINSYNKTQIEFGIYIEVYSNFMESIEYYKELQEYDVNLKLTYHPNLMTPDEFKSKYSILSKPCDITLMFDELLDTYYDDFSNLKHNLQLLDNKKYKFNDIKKFNMIKDYIRSIFNDYVPYEFYIQANGKFIFNIDKNKSIFINDIYSEEPNIKRIMDVKCWVE